VRAALDSFDWDKWRKDLAGQYGEWYEGTLHDAASKAAREYHATWHDDSPFVRRFANAYIGERIRQIEATTREKVAAIIAKRFEDAEQGLSVTELGEVLKKTFAEFSRSRAQTIARTETAMAINHGRLMAYAVAGFEFVLVSDGDHDEKCDRAHGQIWSITYALAHPIQHPNCVRRFSPVARETLPEDFTPDDPED